MVSDNLISKLRLCKAYMRTRQTKGLSLTMATSVFVGKST